MASTLAARLEKLEAKLAPPEAALRCWTVVCNEGDEAAAGVLAQAHGYDPDDDGHLLITRSIVTPAGRLPNRREPYLLDRFPG
ncbi:hypothetical protein [Mesorhizobium marinum]|uniref:Uncharacterized protein n=1 Tax=Mesorhizobium marinum TaxID=3228790 RepID=A0ABV3QW53_9HYPH